MQAYKFHFCGSPVQLKTDNAEDVVQAVQSEIEMKVQEIKAAHRDLPLHKILMLVCFDFSEEMFFLKRAIRKNLNHLESDAKNLLKDLESSNS